VLDVSLRNTNLIQNSEQGITIINSIFENFTIDNCVIKSNIRIKNINSNQVYILNTNFIEDVAKGENVKRSKFSFTDVYGKIIFRNIIFLCNINIHNISYRS
jgi:hypothetical protein